MKTIYVTLHLLTMSMLLSTGVSSLAADKTSKTSKVAEKSTSKAVSQKTTKPTTQASYKAAVQQTASHSNLKTNIQFGESTIRGQRQRPLGHSTEVESEKNIPNLIEYRDNFNDRINKSKVGTL